MSDLIAGYVRHMKAAAMSRNTVRDREELLHRLDRDLPMGLERATVEELADWLARDGWSPKTRATYYETIRAIFKWATDPRSPILDYDPSASLARPKVYRNAPKPITEDEMRRVLDRTSGFWQLSAILAGYAGARCCEVAAISREDITEDSTRFHGKGGKVAAVPTHPLLWRAVRAFPRGSLAEQHFGRPVSAAYVSAMFARRAAQAGLTGVTLHRLRHRFATILLMPRELGGCGADLRTVQELMRHASPQVTSIYTQITDRQRQIAVAALPIFAPSPC